MRLEPKERSTLTRMDGSYIELKILNHDASGDSRLPAQDTKQDAVLL